MASEPRSGGSETTLIVVLMALAAAGIFVWRQLKRWGLVGNVGDASAKVSAGVGHSIVTKALLFHALLMLAVAALTAGLGILAGILAVRLQRRRRRARSMRVDQIILGPNDTAEPFEVMSALDAIHGQMLTRYVRSGMGQDSFSFEIVRTSDGFVHFLLAAPTYDQDWLRVVEDTLRSKYTNIRFEPWTDEIVRWPVAQQIVLGKHWRHATETLKDYQNSPVETIVQALDRADGPAHLQILLTPIPSEPMHTKLRSHIYGMERSANAAKQVDPASPGVGYAASQAVKDSLQLYGKKAFRVEIRLGATTWNTMQRVYGALREADSENSFAAATVWNFRSQWITWLYSRLPSMFVFRSSVMFSFPLATIVHLPTNRLRINSLVRSYVRRGPATLVIPHASSVETALVLDHETNAPLSVPEGDRESGILAVGGQGSGKTTDLLAVFRSDVRYRDAGGRPKCVVLIDIGKDTSRRALGLVPPDRKVYYVAPGFPDCPWTIQPLRGALNDAVMAENVVNAMQEVFGDQAIQFRSKEFLGNAFAAVREVMGDDGDFPSAYRLLTDESFRNQIIAHVQDDHQKAYWQHTFVRAMEVNPRFLEEGLSAPRNKLDELLRNPLIRQALSATSGRRFLDLREVIKERGVLIVNLDKARLGDGGVKLMGVFLVTLLWYAMQGQNDIEERERTKVSLILDEAQNYLAGGFLDMLTEGRAYGLQVMLAIRFLGEITSEPVVKGLQQLIQNVILHQFQLVDEAKDFMMRFMRTWANAVQVNAESQDAVNFGVDDMLRLPKFTSICQWMVDGAVQPAFYARTINWEPFFRPEWRDAHLAEQPVVTPDAAKGETSVGSGSPMDGDLVFDLGVPDGTAGGEDGLVLELPDDQPPPAEPAAARVDGGVAPDLPSLVLGKEVVERLLEQGRDELTGVFNRRVWERAVEAAAEAGNAIAFIDLNDLTGVNNTGGHAKGDELLRRAGEALRRVTRQNDIAARLGGDEFAILAPGMAEEALEPWRSRIERELAVSEVSASVGVAFQEAGEALGETIRRADAAMYAVKPAKLARAHVPPPASVGPPPAGVAQDPGHTVVAAPTPRAAGVGPGCTPGPGTVSKGPGARASRDTLALPATWKGNDPRRVLCATYHMSEALLVQVAAQMGASNEDLMGASLWGLNTDLTPDTALERVRKVIGLKREDRLLRPFARRMRLDLDGVRARIRQAGLRVPDAVDALAEGEDVETIEDLVAGVRRRGARAN